MAKKNKTSDIHLNIPSDAPIKAKVKAHIYSRHESPPPRTINYKGTKLNVLRKIADAHSYGYDDEDTVDELINNVKDRNGDGCDFIYYFKLDGEVLINEDPNIDDEEEVEC